MQIEKDRERTLMTLEAGPGVLCSIAWSPDGGFIVSSHDDDIFRFWDTRGHLKNKTVTRMDRAAPPPCRPTCKSCPSPWRN